MKKILIHVPCIIVWGRFLVLWKNFKFCSISKCHPSGSLSACWPVMTAVLNSTLGTIRVAFVVDKVRIFGVFLRVLQFPIIIPPSLSQFPFPYTLSFHFQLKNLLTDCHQMTVYLTISRQLCFSYFIHTILSL